MWPDFSSYFPKDKDADGWLVDDIFGVNPIDDSKKAVTSAIVPDFGVMAWTKEALENVGEYGKENLPLVEKATVAMGLGVAATGVAVLGAGAFLAYEALHILGNAPNVGKAIKAMDPSELARAANPFGRK